MGLLRPISWWWPLPASAGHSVTEAFLLSKGECGFERHGGCTLVLLRSSHTKPSSDTRNLTSFGHTNTGETAWGAVPVMLR